MPRKALELRVAATIVATIVLLITCRFWLAAAIPLTDTTEARYGEMARKMVETGNWLMPMHDYGVPYLAKPPLAIWLSALGIEVLGPNELGPRLLILLSGIGFLVILYRWLERELGPRSAAAGVLILSSSVLFFVALGAVMTDLVLVVCVNIALLAFWQRIHQQDHPSEWDRSQWVFFIAVGLGLLTKGPLAAFLVAAPILVWALLCGRLLDTWRRMSWLRGGLIVGLVALPWYIAAEWKYPGFLRYFLIGENLQRFLVTDWKGDLYGPVHEVPHGAIWLFLSLGALPWSLLAPFAGFRARGAIRSNWHKHRELALFAGVSTLVPMVLFTVAQNVIAPYALPALVPLVIAAVVLLGEDMLSTRFMLGTAATAAATGFLLTVGSAMLSGAIERESERELVAAAKIEAPLQALHYWRHRYYSADYYSSGQTSVLHETDEIQRLLEGGTPFLLAMTDADFSDLPAEIASSLRRTGAYSKKVIFSPKSLLANEAVQWAHP